MIDAEPHTNDGATFIYKRVDKKDLLFSRESSILVKGVNFMAANTIEEAQRYFTDVLGLTSNDYTAMHIDVANMVNKEVMAIYDAFGDVNAGGYLKGVRVTTELPLNSVAAYVLPSKEIALRKADVMYGTSIAKMGVEARQNLDIGFWSTNAPEHAVRHELGHAVWYWLMETNAAKRIKISALRKQLFGDVGINVWDMVINTKAQKLAAGRLISYYALMSDKELIAESIAEYRAGNPRGTAKKVIEILTGG